MYSARGHLRGQSEMTVASRAEGALRRLAGAGFRLEVALDKPTLTWGSPTTMEQPLPRPELYMWARTQRTGVTILVLV